MYEPRASSEFLYSQLFGVGGIGTGLFFNLEGEHTLGRNESRTGQLLDVRDFCKLHIVAHYISTLLGARASPSSFQVFPVGKVGDDAAGRFVLSEMQQAGINTHFITTVRDAPTLLSICFQYPDGTGGNITTSNSAASKLSEDELSGPAELFRSLGSRSIALAVPEAPFTARHKFLSLASSTGAFCAASFTCGEIEAARRAGLFQLLDLVALNESEASILLGCDFCTEDPQKLADKCLSFISKTSTRLRLIVTIGGRGAFGFVHDMWNNCPAPRVPVKSTAGAGDALLAGVIAAITLGIPFIAPIPMPSKVEKSVDTALEFGVLLASYTVTSPHSIHPDVSLEAIGQFARDSGISICPSLKRSFTTRRASADNFHGGEVRQP